MGPEAASSFYLTSFVQLGACLVGGTTGIYLLRGNSPGLIRDLPGPAWYAGDLYLACDDHTTSRVPLSCLCVSTCVEELGADPGNLKR